MDKELLFSYISGHATDAQIKEVIQWTSTIFPARLSRCQQDSLWSPVIST